MENKVDLQKRDALKKAAMGAAVVGAGVVGLSSVANADFLFNKGGTVTKASDIPNPSTGTAGQVLTTTGSAVAWATAGASVTANNRVQLGTGTPAFDNTVQVGNAFRLHSTTKTGVQFWNHDQTEGTMNNGDMWVNNGTVWIKTAGLRIPLYPYGWSGPIYYNGTYM